MKKFFYSQKLAPYVFILPFVLTVIFFWAVPIANGVLLSFQDVLTGSNPNTFQTSLLASSDSLM